jgi:hypothetical protein
MVVVKFVSMWVRCEEKWNVRGQSGGEIESREALIADVLRLFNALQTANSVGVKESNPY